jgi:uncharacterized protein YjbI with pentapeptide repeats
MNEPEAGERRDLRGQDLREQDLSGWDLRRADLREADLSGAILDDADLEGADLEGAILEDASLIGAYLVGARLQRANLADADLSQANLSRADLADATLRSAALDKTHLIEATLDRADLGQVEAKDVLAVGASFAGACLEGARFLRSDLSFARFVGARLADFTGDRSSFHGCVLEQVDAPDASFEFADLSAASLERAVLREASLVRAELHGADFAGADLVGADLNWTRFDPASAAGARLEHARLPAPTRIAFGPKGVTPPEVQAKPMFPEPLGAADLAAKAVERRRAARRPVEPDHG